MKTVHLVFNAHLDPIWLWPWEAGLDEVLNTCETVCGLLERHPDVIFTRGEAWVYEQIRLLNHGLFRRIKRLIRRGQWEPVGGWYVQPDCNLPSGFGLEKQVELGRDWFQRYLGEFPKIAYNVDSFGHCSYLPELMAKFGQTHYVMMRPMENEMALPARLFRWRGHKGGPEVTVFRIAGSYCTQNGITLPHVEESLSRLPEGVEHTMCFVGVGDHGGGPSEGMIAWCREHRDAIPGARLEFSSPKRFFKAVAKNGLPLVTGELQMHAVGCYSVHRPVKLAVRKSEHLLAQAERALKGDAALGRLYASEVKKAWEYVCFSHFHDTLGGTCLPSAYAQVEAHLGYSRAVADEVLQYALRRHTMSLPPDRRQRLIFGNYLDKPFEGWIEHEPWLEWTEWQPDWCLIDEKGREVPHQLMGTEAVFPHNRSPRVLFPMKIPASGFRVLRIARRTKPILDALQAPEFEIKKSAGGDICFLHEGSRFPAPKLLAVSDPSDTWSHGVRSYEGAVAAGVRWGMPVRLDRGPLMGAWEVSGRLGAGTVHCEWRAYAGEKFLELRLRAEWREFRRLLRLSWSPGGGIRSHVDGVAGGRLLRPSNGLEYPVQDWTLLNLAGGSSAGAVMPDTSSMSVTAGELRLTLLRSPYMADHDHDLPKKFTGRQRVSDQGAHEFLFRFFPAGTATPSRLENQALLLHRPPLVSELTCGMPWRGLACQIERPL